MGESINPSSLKFNIVVLILAHANPSPIFPLAIISSNLDSVLRLINDFLISFAIGNMHAIDLPLIERLTRVNYASEIVLRVMADIVIFLRFSHSFAFDYDFLRLGEIEIADPLVF